MTTASDIQIGQTIEWTGRHGTRRLTVTETYPYGEGSVQVNGTNAAGDDQQVFLRAEHPVTVAEATR